MIKRRDYRFLHGSKGRSRQEDVEDGEDARSSGSSSLSDSEGSASDSEASHSDADSELHEEPAPPRAGRAAPAAKAQRKAALPPEVASNVKGPKGAGAGADDARGLGAGKKNRSAEECSGKDTDTRVGLKAPRDLSQRQKTETGKREKGARKKEGERGQERKESESVTVEKEKKGGTEEKRKREESASEKDGGEQEEEEALSSDASEGPRGGPSGRRRGPREGWGSQWAEAVEEDEVERALRGHPSDSDEEEGSGSDGEGRGALGWRRKGQGAGSDEEEEGGDGESEEALLVLRLGKGGNVLRCRVCPSVVCLNDPSMEAHLVSKKHKAALRRLSKGTLPAMLNSDGELEEDGETHRERLQRVEEARKARQEGDPRKKRRRGKGKGRQRQRERKRLKLQRTEGSDPAGK